MGIVTLTGERPHHGEAGQTQAAEPSLSPTRHHHVGGAAPNHFRRFANRVIASGAGRDDRRVVPQQAVPHRNIGGRHIGQDARQKERLNPHAPTLEQDPGHLFDVWEPPVTIPQNDASALAIHRIEIETGILECLARRRQRQLRKTGHAPRRFAVDEVGWLKLANLAADRAAKLAGIERLDRFDPTLTLNTARPERIDTHTQRRRSPKARHHNPSPLSAHRLPPSSLSLIEFTGPLELRLARRPPRAGCARAPPPPRRAIPIRRSSHRARPAVRRHARHPPRAAPRTTSLP